MREIVTTAEAETQEHAHLPVKEGGVVGKSAATLPTTPPVP
jgi:hypothetical protein